MTCWGTGCIGKNEVYPRVEVVIEWTEDEKIAYRKAHYQKY